MKIKEFATERGIEPQAVTRYMGRHGMKYDRSAGLTPAQLEVLEKKYQLPKPVQLVEDTETMRELIATQKQLLEAQKALLVAQKSLAEAEAQKLLLEDKEAQLALLRQETEGLKKELGSFKKSIFGLYRRVF